MGRDGRPEEEERSEGAAGAGDGEMRAEEVGTTAGAWWISERVPGVDRVIGSLIGEELRLLADTGVMGAEEEDEGARRGGLTASSRAGLSRARLASNGLEMVPPEPTEDAGAIRAGAGNSLDLPIELLA